MKKFIIAFSIFIIILGFGFISAPKTSEAYWGINGGYGYGPYGSGWGVNFNYNNGFNNGYNPYFNSYPGYYGYGNYGYGYPYQNYGYGYPYGNYGCMPTWNGWC